ncbi:MAG TPA: hypothetical protein VMF90_12315 [Rhizobiaceae bacterium]|nr:hypothetical protein [Rhizobiaceae bacterium]
MWLSLTDTNGDRVYVNFHNVAYYKRWNANEFTTITMNASAGDRAMTLLVRDDVDQIGQMILNYED